MTAILGKKHERVPQVERLGFTDGWLFLPPTFLDLQLPVVIVDQAYVGDPHQYGLETFGTRDPTTPLPTTKLTLRWFGDVVVITTHGESSLMIITGTIWAAHSHVWMINNFDEVVVLVGRTYELESSWAALWAMAIGRASIAHPETAKEIANEGDGTSRPLG